MPCFYGDGCHYKYIYTKWNFLVDFSTKWHYVCGIIRRTLQFIDLIISFIYGLISQADENLHLQMDLTSETVICDFCLAYDFAFLLEL